MFITLCAFVLVLFLQFFAFPHLPTDHSRLGLLMLSGGTVVFVAGFFFDLLILKPMESLERKLVPGLMEIVRRDRILHWSSAALFLFTLFSYAWTVLVFENTGYENLAFFIWLILFGASLDLLRCMRNRAMHFLTPSYLVKYISQNAVKAIQEDDDDTLWSDLDGLSEICLNAADKGKIALSTQTLQAIPPVIHTFFDSSKSISRENRDKEVEEATGRDEANYTVFYLLQRLETINDRALQNRLETVCRQMIISTGKIIVYAAKFDLTMVAFPVHFLTKFGLKAQQHHFDEVGVLTTGTLIEIAKTIATDIDLKYTELQDPFRSIINGLDALAKGTFKKNKNTDISVLIQPFLDIKEFLKSDRMVGHPDTPVIEAEIDRIIEEYRVLEQVVQGIPVISGGEET